MSEKIRIEKGSVQETLIIPLYGRKLCTERFPQLFQDKEAKRICDSLDYDFSELEKQSASLIYEFGALEGAMRGFDMQWEVCDYLKDHPNAAVVNLGCGLDQTGTVCSNGTCKVYNVDMPDTIEARSQLLGGEQATNIACNLTDHSWMDQIDASGGAVFFAAGVFHYLTFEDMRALMAELASRFPGGRLIFDAVGKLGQRVMMKTVLRNFDMSSAGGLFCAEGPQDVQALCDKIRVTDRGYMLGYNDMRDPAIRSIHRVLARLGDGPLKMRIYRVEL